MRESQESREQWARRHHCAQTDFEELAWIYCQDTDKLRAEVERLRAKADARAVIELQWVANMMRGGVFDSAWTQARVAINDRIAELSKPAAKESEQQHGQESTATAAPSRSPQGEGVEVPPRGQEQGASRPRGIGQPAHPPGARGGESGIVAEPQGHRPGEAVRFADLAVGAKFTLGGWGGQKLPATAMPSGCWFNYRHSEGLSWLDPGTLVQPVKESEPAQDERFGDWPLRDYVAGYNPLTASPLETAVYHLCKTAVRK